ncbi:hypothetical protein Clacol_005279 [Clathrus columnatus]|uniref:Protein kinase domain-containing protein n=1 Tax=Clathrus columnatus TaxID=1419009 RepID=A0AAV5AD39_9AGAM|nr:hypothetical protein Clacol_005279 [Clathrus columnatus]
MNLKTGVTIALLFALLNKVAGVYGLIAVFTGGSAAQLSMYIYSVFALIALTWGLKAVGDEDPKRVLYFAHMFFLDHLFSTCWTVFFGVVWWVYTPHDGKRVANSDAQRAMMGGASGNEGHNMTEAERTAAALGIWNKEKSFAAAVLIIGWLIKAILDEDDEQEDSAFQNFYSQPQQHIPHSSIASWSDFIPAPKQKSNFSEDVDEVLFDEDEVVIGGGIESGAHSKMGTEETTSVSTNGDEREDTTYRIRTGRINILGSASVAELRKTIKAEKIHQTEHVDADQITLWKLSNPILRGRTRDAINEFFQKIKEINFPNPESEEALNGTGPVQYLLSTKLLSDYWMEHPEPRYLHIIVQVPPRSVDNETHAFRGTKRKLDALVEPSPSSFANPDLFQVLIANAVQCNRPFEYDILPIALLQQEFADFRNDCTQEPSAMTIQLLEDLTVAACKWYEREEHRRDAIKDAIFNTTNLSVSPGVIKGTTRTTDGSSEPVIIPAIIRKCKNNDGCALFQAIGYYTNFVHERLDLEEYTLFPSILMTDIGGKVIVEPLTLVYDLTVHWMDDEARHKIAATLDAVLKTVARLDRYYLSVKSTPTEIQTEYPFWTAFVNSTGSRTHFTYIGRVAGKLIYLRQYSETVHRFLANLKHAPLLLAVNDVGGGWKMVVMEYSQYTRLDSSALRLNDESRRTIKQQVQEIVKKLHAQELVHGDIRQVNILVDKKTLDNLKNILIHLVDFNWARQAGIAKYPLRINTRSIRRPSDVAGGTLITKSHDLAMIDFLFYSV